MNLLLAAGANPLAAVSMALTFDIAPAVERLLQCDLPLFDQSVDVDYGTDIRPAYFLRSFHVWKDIECSIGTARALIGALKNRRDVLANLAVEHLSSNENCN